jgi:hypothetical protein
MDNAALRAEAATFASRQALQNACSSHAHLSPLAGPSEPTGIAQWQARLLASNAGARQTDTSCASMCPRRTRSIAHD